MYRSEPHNVARKNEPNSDSDSDSEPLSHAPKQFLAKSLAESLFIGLLQNLRHPGIPRQKGFIHLNRLEGYGATVATKRFPKSKTWQIRPLQGVLRSTMKLTQQAIQEACEKERQRRIRAYHQNGIPRCRPFIDFLDEFRELVRDAERHGQIEASKKDIRTSTNWASVMEELRHKGLLRNIKREIELQRQYTIKNIYSMLFDHKSRKESVAMAAVHDARKAVHDDLKNAVKRMMEQANAERDNLTTYYMDLKDQMVQALQRKALAVRSMQQLHVEARVRWEQNQELRDDPVRRRAIQQREKLHKELRNLYSLIKRDKVAHGHRISQKQRGLKDAMLEDVLDTYWKEKTYMDFAQAKHEKIMKTIDMPVSEQVAQQWDAVQHEIKNVTM